MVDSHETEGTVKLITLPIRNPKATNRSPSWELEIHIVVNVETIVSIVPADAQWSNSSCTATFGQVTYEVCMSMDQLAAILVKVGAP